MNEQLVSTVLSFSVLLLECHRRLTKTPTMMLNRVPMISVNNEMHILRQSSTIRLQY
jgi:hypothetical protein